ncbi:MAG: 4Fe-4S binding protein [Candidatus Magnetomorum sp.]|nr:4Fe-4S binding protein [Candidatus Magnetomorum sp.]
MILSKLRQWVQLISTILSNSYIGSFYTKMVSTHSLKGVCVPFLNCYSCPTAVFACPIGTLQHFMSIHMIPYYLVSFMSLIGISIGRMACGWVCPFGFIQDQLYKAKTKKYTIPNNFRYIKYLVLIFLVIVIPWLTGELWFSKLCPAGTLFAGIPWALWNPENPSNGRLLLPNGPGVFFYFTLLILFGFLAWFVVSKRPFCRVFCPLGAFFGLFNRFSLIRLEVSHQCDGCNTCQQSCPVDLNVFIDGDSGECIRCLECTRCDHVRVISEISQINEMVRNLK